MAWFDNLFSSAPTEEQLRAAQAIGQPLNFGEVLGAGVSGAGDALTDPGTYLAAAPWGRALTLAGRGGTVVGGRVAGGGGTGQVRRLAAGRQGGTNYPATQGGLPATQGGLPAVRGNTWPTAQRVDGGRAAGGGGRGGGGGGGSGGRIGRDPEPARLPPPRYADGPVVTTTPGQTLSTRNRILAALGLGIGGISDIGRDGGEPPEMPAMAPEAVGRQGRYNPYAHLVAQSGDIGGGNLRPFETLMTPDYEGLRGMRPDSQAFLEALGETAPEAPRDRHWTQDLSRWAIPAVAGGILGGPLGLIMGGLMGEGGRRDRNAAEEQEYQERLAQFNRDMARATYGTQGEDYAREIDFNNMVRRNQMDDYQFGADQRGERRDEDSHVRNAAALQQRMVSQALADARTGQQLEIGELQLNSLFGGGMEGLGGGIRPSDQISRLLETDPYAIEQLMQNDKFMQASTMTNGPMKDALLGQAVMELQHDPILGPALQQIQQQQQMQNLIRNF